MSPAHFVVREVGVVGKAVGRSGTRRAAALMAGAVVLVGALVGCSARPGVAAVVNGTTITTAELGTTVTDLKPVSGAVDPDAVLNVLALEPIYASVAAKHQLAVSDDDAKALLKQAYTGQSGVPDSSGLLAIARFQLISQKISAAADVQAIGTEISAEIAKAKVSVNPRFGNFDAASATTSSLIGKPASSPWLVAVPTPTPTPTA
jgi:hypothetical protein